jgi:acetyl esterase
VTEFEAARAQLTPRMAGVLDRIRRAGRPPFHTLGVAEARRVYEAAAEVLDLPRARLPVVENLSLPAADGTPLQARRYAPAAATPGPLPTVLYLHGGGFVVGSIDTHDSLCRQIAQRSGWAVVSLGYRLAPEHRFPTAVEDAWAAMHALLAQADGRPIAVAGDSAGGTLAAVCALHARDVGLPLALQVLITPGTAPHADTDSHRRWARGGLLSAETIAWFFSHYTRPTQRQDWRFAPLLADVEGVAPACLVLAEADPLFDEGLAYGDLLRCAGVPVQLELAAGVTHDFIKMGRVLPEASAALDAIARALKSAHAADPDNPDNAESPSP